MEKIKDEELSITTAAATSASINNMKQNSNIITIGIAGGTGAGKTTLAEAIYNALGKEKNISYIKHDNYYKDISYLSIEERSKINFDHPNSLDTDLLIEHIKTLKLGSNINVPIYDFTTHSRLKD